MENADGRSWQRFVLEVFVAGTILALAGSAWRAEYISSWTHGLIVGATLGGSVMLERGRPYRRSWPRLIGTATLAFVVAVVAAGSVLLFP
jgi:hypothetical protein